MNSGILLVGINCDFYGKRHEINVSKITFNWRITIIQYSSFLKEVSRLHPLSDNYVGGPFQFRCAVTTF